MKIFLPFKKSWNPYLDEIQKHTLNTFIYDSYKNYDPSYKIVNVHWPESIFDWLEPTDDQLIDLELEIENWKKHSRIVYTKHDVDRHKGMTPNFKKLFELIEIKSDVFIHLGNYSKQVYLKLYPEAEHKVVYHPLYENTFQTHPKREARASLNIDQEAVVIIAPGSIRNFAERKMILNAFKKLKIQNKVLITTNMRSEIKFEFPGRVALKKIFDVRNFVVNEFKRRHQTPEFMFSYERLNDHELSLRMSAADIVLIPRINILNSGNLHLALTFNKIVVGPAIGNIGEQLRFLNMPLFDPNSNSSVTQALEKGLALNNSKFVFQDEVISKFKPKNVAKAMDLVFVQCI